MLAPAGTSQEYAVKATAGDAAAGGPAGVTSGRTAWVVEFIKN
jgi:hypothetical protein